MNPKDARTTLFLCRSSSLFGNLFKVGEKDYSKSLINAHLPWVAFLRICKASIM